MKTDEKQGERQEAVTASVASAAGDTCVGDASSKASSDAHASGVLSQGGKGAAGKRNFREALFEGVLRFRAPIIIVFVVASIAGGICSQFVGVDYDMNDYLPVESASTQAIDTMEEQFDGAIPNARVMVRDVSVAEALDYKAQLEAVDGVTSVTWLDDAVDVATPLAVADQDTVETYYVDGNALFSIAIEDAQRQSAVSEIRDIIGDENCMTGSAVSSAVATESTVSQIRIIAIVAVLFILFVLALTTRSWADAILVMCGLGVSVMLNNGTNLMFGTISFVTNAAGSILQIAIALDFSVFLLHRYSECRLDGKNAHDAMLEAMCRTSTAIVSSACTVMIGFLALTVMQFGIGPDLGYALAKGILISLVTVFTFTPSLYVCADKFREKLKHRSFVPSLDGFAHGVQKICIPCALVVVLLPVPAFLASTSDDINYLYGSSHIFGTETQYGADTQEIESVFGQRDTYVLMVPSGDTAAEKQLSDELHDIPQVKSIISYVDNAGSAMPEGIVGESTLSQLEGSEYSRMVITVDAAYEGDETFALVQEVRDVAQSMYPDEWLLAGEGVSTTDLMTTIMEDKDKVDLIAVGAVLAVLLLATRSISLPIILVFVIETSIWLNFSIPYYTGASEFFIAYLIVSSIQLGVTVDYAILLTDRYKEKRRVMPKQEALWQSVRSVFIPVSTSGVVLTVVGFVLSAVSTHGVLSQLGHYLGVGVLMSLVCVVVALPGFLYVLDGVIAKTTLGAHFLMPEKGAKSKESGSEGEITQARTPATK